MVIIVTPYKFDKAGKDAFILIVAPEITRLSLFFFPLILLYYATSAFLIASIDALFLSIIIIIIP